MKKHKAGKVSIGSKLKGRKKKPHKPTTGIGKKKAAAVVLISLALIATGLTLFKSKSSSAASVCKTGHVCVVPSSGKHQVTLVTISWGSKASVPSAGYSANFTDTATHITYRTQSLPGSQSRHSFKTYTPYEPCIQASQATQTTSPGKNGKTSSAISFSVTLASNNGDSPPKLVPGKFKMTCKSGTLVAFADKPAPDTVPPDGKSTSTISVHLYTVWVDGNIPPQPAGGWAVPGQNGVSIAPLGGVRVNFTTDLGTLTSSNGSSGQMVYATTDMSGTASVTISSSLVGIAHITPIAKDRIGEGSLNSSVQKLVHATPGPTKPYKPLEVNFPPTMVPISALFVPAYYTTYYTEGASPSTGLTYKWSVSIPPDPGCAAGFSQDAQNVNQADWYHADDSEGGPCSHGPNQYGPKGHPGIVTVVVSGGGFTCQATYDGTLTGKGPNPSGCSHIPGS